MGQTSGLHDPARGFRPSPELRHDYGRHRDAVDDALAAAVAWFGCSVADVLVPLRLSRLPRDAYYRARHLIAWAACRLGGATYGSVAELLGCTEQSVHAWIRAAEECRGRRHFAACAEFAGQVMEGRTAMRELEVSCAVS